MSDTASTKGLLKTDVCNGVRHMGWEDHDRQLLLTSNKACVVFFVYLFFHSHTNANLMKKFNFRVLSKKLKGGL